MTQKEEIHIINDIEFSICLLDAKTKNGHLTPVSAAATFQMVRKKMDRQYLTLQTMSLLKRKGKFYTICFIIVLYIFSLSKEAHWIVGQIVELVS